MPPYFEVSRDSNGKEIKSPVNTVFYRSRVLLVPREDQVRVFLPVGSTVNLWKTSEVEGEPKKTEIRHVNNSVDLKGGVDMRAVIVPPSGEPVTLVWEPSDEEKETLLNEKVEKALEDLQNHAYYPWSIMFTAYAESLWNKTPKTWRDYLKIAGTESTGPFVCLWEMICSLPARYQDYQSGKWQEEERRLRQKFS